MFSMQRTYFSFSFTARMSILRHSRRIEKPSQSMSRSSKPPSSTIRRAAKATKPRITPSCNPWFSAGSMSQARTLLCRISVFVILRTSNTLSLRVHSDRGSKHSESARNSLSASSSSSLTESSFKAIVPPPEKKATCASFHEWRHAIPLELYLQTGEPHPASRMRPVSWTHSALCGREFPSRLRQSYRLSLTVSAVTSPGVRMARSSK